MVPSAELQMGKSDCLMIRETGAEALALGWRWVGARAGTGQEGINRIVSPYARETWMERLHHTLFTRSLCVGCYFFSTPVYPIAAIYSRRRSFVSSSFALRFQLPTSDLSLSSLAAIKSVIPRFSSRLFLEPVQGALQLRHSSGSDPTDQTS